MKEYNATNLVLFGLLILVMGIVIGMAAERNDYRITETFEDGSFYGCRNGGTCNDLNN